MSEVLRGYDRRTARSIAQARQLLERHTCSLLLLGTRVPSANVELFLQWARERQPQLAIACVALHRHSESWAQATDLVLELRRFSNDFRGDRHVRRLLDGLVESASNRPSASSDRVKEAGSQRTG